MTPIHLIKNWLRSSIRFHKAIKIITNCCLIIEYQVSMKEEEAAGRQSKYAQNHKTKRDIEFTGQSFL